jgi:hypothetical protein
MLAICGLAATAFAWRSRRPSRASLPKCEAAKPSALSFDDE